MAKTVQKAVLCQIHLADPLISLPKMKSFISILNVSLIEQRCVLLICQHTTSPLPPTFWWWQCGESDSLYL